MRNVYNNHFHHQQPQNLHQRSTFLPRLCSRFFIKDAVLQLRPNPTLHHHHGSATASIHPSSPRGSCIGHVKIRNNKVNASTFPTPPKPPAAAANNDYSNMDYHKLIKLYSGKNNLTAATRREVANVDRGPCKLSDIIIHNDDFAPAVNIAQLDPPLPVVTKLQAGREEVNLWKRRSGGVALKSLELKT